MERVVLVGVVMVAPVEHLAPTEVVILGAVRVGLVLVLDLLLEDLVAPVS
jgi:hypothetical protein